MFGYIDPAAGATIMQLVVAGTIGIGAVVKFKWHTIRGFFNHTDAMLDRFPESESDSPDVPEQLVEQNT